MSEIIDIFEYMDLDSMNKEQLLAHLQALRTQIEALDAQEPKNMNSEAYEAWGERHEDLEDQVDDVLDRLDDLE